MYALLNVLYSMTSMKERSREICQRPTSPNGLRVKVEEVLGARTEREPILDHLGLGDGYVEKALEPRGLKAGAELLLDPGVEGHREAHVQPGGDCSSRHLLTVPPDQAIVLCVMQEAVNLTGPPFSKVQVPCEDSPPEDALFFLW